MTGATRSLLAIAALTGMLAFGPGAVAQTTAPAENAAPTPDNAVLLTIFLKHDQSRPLGELNAQLEKQGYYKAFPPTGVEDVVEYEARAGGEFGARGAVHVVEGRAVRAAHQHHEANG